MTQPKPAKPAETRRALQRLSDAILLFADAVDAAFMHDKTVPRKAGAKLARLVEYLDVENDQARYFVLGVNYRTDDKAKAVARLKAKRGKL
jgi:hypothetical protein